MLKRQFRAVAEEILESPPERIQQNQLYPNGKYLGAIEVVQDITDIKKLEGEKRLLDWKE